MSNRGGTTIDQAPLAASRAEFLKNLAASSLSGVADNGNIIIPVPDGDGTEMASTLVAAGHLTQFQADAILTGKLTDLRVGNYDILDRLGAGGMGTVFKAKHRRMKRIVALKLLLRSVANSENFVRRFQREVETIARLTHPNIVMAFDADESEAGLFLVMEFVDGRDLHSEVTKKGPLPIATAIDYTVQVARGLGYAHENGMIHRDIKPANLLLDVSGRVKVADLGLARLNDSEHAGATSLTQAGGVLGTIDFMPPEQAVDSTAIDNRADQYSLGATLYFLLTGRPMFTGTGAMAVLLMHRDAPIPSPQAVRPDVPAELEAVFRKMVAKRPEDRFASMAEVVKALEAVPEVLPAAPVIARTHALGELDFSFGSSQNVNLDVTRVVPADGSKELMAPVVAGLAVVLAEASRTQANIIRKFLEQLGITGVRMASSGAQAIEMARTAKTQVVMTSMHLADMTGVQLGRNMRTDPNLEEVGFVLATSGSETEMVADLRGAYRTVLMPKPFDLTRLANALAEAAGIGK